MSKPVFSLASLCAVSSLAFFHVAALSAAEKPESVIDRVSYSIGLDLGRNLNKSKIDANVEYLLQGIKDGLAEAAPLLSEEEKQAAMKALQEELAAVHQAKGNAFLAANKGKEGVVTLPSGLQYKVLKEGSGASPAATDEVKCHYRGTLTDGTQFDSSYDRGEPAQFPLNRVIAGWTEALQLMKVGAKWQLFIPSNLAYGPQGRPPTIPPHATLIFDVELVEIVVK